MLYSVIVYCYLDQKNRIKKKVAYNTIQFPSGHPPEY